MTDLLPILTTTQARHSATKTWRRTAEGWQKVNFAAGMYFTHREVEVGGIYQLTRELEKVSTDPNSFVIRGQIKDEQRSARGIRRQLHGDNAAFDRVPRRWIMLDFDKIELPPGYDLHDTEDAIEWLIGEHLPEPFQWWCFSPWTSCWAMRLW